MNYLLSPFLIIDRLIQGSQKGISNAKVEEGKKYSKECHCIIGSLLRDSSSSFGDGVRKVKDFSKIFKTVDVIIIENDSMDNTRELWEKYSKKCPKNVKIFIENPEIGKYPKTVEHHIYSERIKKMVKLRNNLMKLIKEKSRKFSYDTYIFLTDFDIQGNLEKDGIYDTFYYFLNKKKYDAIGCNGLRYNLFYFDSYAYKNKEVFIPNLDIPINKGLFSVISSFSGGVFYRYDKIINLKYKFKKEKDEIICEHVSLNRQIKMAINTNMIYNIYSY